LLRFDIKENTISEAFALLRFSLPLLLQRPVLYNEVSTPQGPELHLDVSTIQRPLLLLDVSTPQGLELHLDLSTLQRPALHLDGSTLQGHELQLDINK
jgi:hypothetical protein